MAANTTAGVPPETPHELYLDGLSLISSTTVVGTFYGIMTVIAGTCAQTLIRFRRRRTCRRLAFLLAYIVVLWLCGTFYVAGRSLSTQSTYIDHRLYSSGAYAHSQFDQVGTIMTVTSYFVASISANGMMVWRFKVIWRDSRYYWFLIPLPCLMWVAGFVVGLLEYILLSIPQHALYYKLTRMLVLPNSALTITLNVFTTGLMVGRLTMFRRRIQQHEVPGSSTPASKQYTCVAAMLVESCMLYTTCSVLFLGFYVSGHPATTTMVAITSQMQIIGPLLVMLRISQGIAWKEGTLAEMTTRRDTEAQFADSLYVCERKADGDGVDSASSGHDGKEGVIPIEAGPDSLRLPRLREKPSSSSITFAKHELDGVEGVVRADELVRSEV